MSLVRSLAAYSFTSFPLLALATCGASSAEISALQNFVQANPVALAQAALAQGNTEFLGIAGYSIEVPGINESRCIVNQTQVRVVPGTTDFRCSDKHSKLIAAATRAAEKYNNVIKNHLVAKGVFSCVKPNNL